ncbi:MAG: DUF1150 family protein [Magnetovibrio sp.]|nr:DUF1150 family protein [Magnetovibrio sp.]
MEREYNSNLAKVCSDTGKSTLSQFDLANWGLENVAYVKPVVGAVGNSYGIFAADGTELAQMENRDEAIITIRQNDHEALSVH